MTDNRVAYNASIERLRPSEFPQLIGSTYLDHAASTLYPRSLMDGFASNMAVSLYGNPHSESQPSQLTSRRVDDVRLRALDFFGADPDDYHLVFVSNATAGIKLVSDAFRGNPHGFRFAYHQDSHTSVVGAREESVQSVCLDTPAVLRWLDGNPPPFEDTCPISGAGRGDVPPSVLFAYPAQSNMCGRRYPLSWAHGVRADRSARVYTLVDAAAFAASSPVNLKSSEEAPDFTVVSFTKMFGFPDLAALIVRRQATDVFKWRKYFGGGTVDMVVCIQEQWHAPKVHLLHERLEDGTLPIHNVIALDIAFDVHARLYGTMADVAAHTSFLASSLYAGLSQLRHWNGEHVCTLYSRNPDQRIDSQPDGPIVAFNVLSSSGEYLSPSEFDKLASMKRMHIRTGGLCNPGGIAAALNLKPWELRQNFSAGFRCGEQGDVVGGKPAGVIRASLGAMSTLSDVEAFILFVAHFFKSHAPPAPVSIDFHPSSGPKVLPGFSVRDIFVYPIKSCGAFQVPRSIAWDVRPEGLAWDREWVLVHRGTGQALSQKRYPQMALLHPFIDQKEGVLRVSFNDKSKLNHEQVSIPLSNNPALFKPTTNSRLVRVCGDEIRALMYDSEDTNAFFSAALGVPCELARFPPRARPRRSKARFQRHQQPYAPQLEALPQQQTVQEHHILLANESAILLVNTVSVDALNKEVRQRGGNREITPRTFRPNIVVGPSTIIRDDTKRHELAHVEDDWASITIGQCKYTMAGSCRRCQMVCVDQITGEKHEEPLATLSKTRRFDGKIFFGIHMYLSVTQSKLPHCTRIQVDDSIKVG